MRLNSSNGERAHAFPYVFAVRAAWLFPKPSLGGSGVSPAWAHRSGHGVAFSLLKLKTKENQHAA